MHRFELSRRRFAVAPWLVLVFLSACRPPPLVTFFTAEPFMLAPGEASQLSWASTGTESCHLEPLGMDVGISGAVSVTPAVTTEYVLTCGAATASTTITVTDRIVSFVANPSSIAAGDTFSLVWNAHASGCQLDQGLGTVPLMGTRSLRPSASTTYTLTCGTAQRTAAITVGAVQPDPFFASQWHLVNTGQNGGTRSEDLHVEPVWAELRGEGVRVAVVDDGVDLNHEDLRANGNVADSHDYLGNATVDLAEHGTSVAGVIGARDVNGVGGRGVAPRSELVSYNFLQDNTSAGELDAMVRGMAVNGVSNNSWGDADDGTGLLTQPDAMWLMGVSRGTSEGRGGKGVVYLFPSGNGANDRYPDDSNFDGQANSRFVLTIGGVSDDGRRADYSEPGANVLVSTPAGERGAHYVFTTDITGMPGYNNGRTPGEPSNANYTSTFDGTSAATPMASGAVVLMLQANPNLTWRDVRRLLALTARKNDPANPDWALNGAGLHVNHEYGFGVVDVARAVAEAKTYDAGVREVSFVSPLASPNLAIPDNTPAGISSTITVTNGGVRLVDVVEVTVTIAHPASGDLDVRLVHGATRSRIHPNHTCMGTCTAITGFVFTSVRHLDEAGDGEWRLEVRDAAPQDVGRLVSWKLALYGRP